MRTRAVAALLAATMLAAPTGRAGLPPGGSSCPLDKAAARVYAHCYRSPTVSLTVPPASTAVCEKPPDGPLFLLPDDFTAADVARTTSFIYDSSGVLVNATVGKSDPAEGPWRMDAKIARAGHNWTITSKVSYDQSAGCFGKGATRHIYALVYYGTPETGTLHIGSVSVSLSERLKRLARELRPQVDALVKQKEKFDADLPAQRLRFEQASAAVADAERKIPPLTAQVEQTQAFVKQIIDAEPGSSNAAEVQARDSLDQAMARLQPQIIEAHLAGDTARARSLESRLASDEEQLKSLEHALAGKDKKADDLRDRWLARLKALKDQLFALQTQQAKAERERWVAGDELHRTLAQGASIDEQLVAVGAKLADLDFDLTSVSVTADGKKVYEAELSGPGRHLLELDAEIAAMKPVLTDLDAKRKEAAKHVLDLENEALAAGKVVADTILSVARKKAGVDFAYNVYDVVRAASKGGLFGAGVETLKKAGEGLAQYLTDNDKTGSKELDKLYNGELNDAFSDTLLKAGRDRLVKELAVKPLKDKVSQNYLSKLFSKIYPDVRLPAGAVPAPAAPANVAEHFRSFIKSFSDREAHLAQLKKGITNPFSSLENAKSVAGDLVGKFLIDASKNLAKAYFDAQEQEAFAAYFGKQMLVRLYFPMWQIASSTYWEALDSYNALLDQKAELLKGYSDETHTRTTFDEKFAKDAKLLITVKVVRPAGTTGTIDLEVTVGGKAAVSAGGYRYTIGASGLKEDAKGLGLRLTAR